MRKCVLLFVFALMATPALAQGTVTDHWPSARECLAATGPYYVPRVKNPQPVKRGEQVIGYEWGGCFDMALTAKEGGRGWVRLPPGSRVVVDVISGKPLRLEECNNRIYGFEPFPPPEKLTVQASAASPTVVVDTKPIADAIAAHAKDAKPDQLTQPFVVKVVKDDEPQKLSWLSPKRRSGQIFWGSMAAVAAVCGFKCRFTVEQTVIVKH
jgi:hypothetical protein